MKGKYLHIYGSDNQYVLPVTHCENWVWVFRSPNNFVSAMIKSATLEGRQLSLFSTALVLTQLRKFFMEFLSDEDLEEIANKQICISINICICLIQNLLTMATFNIYWKSGIGDFLFVNRLCLERLLLNYNFTKI